MEKEKKKREKHKSKTRDLGTRGIVSCELCGEFFISTEFFPFDRSVSIKVELNFFNFSSTDVSVWTSYQRK